MHRQIPRKNKCGLEWKQCFKYGDIFKNSLKTHYHVTYNNIIKWKAIFSFFISLLVCNFLLLMKINTCPYFLNHQSCIQHCSDKFFHFMCIKIPISCYQFGNSAELWRDNPNWLSWEEKHQLQLWCKCIRMLLFWWLKW